MKFGHIGIKVLNMNESIKFYENILEAKVIKDYIYPESHIVFIEVADTIIELIGKKKNTLRDLGPIEHIAFKVESLEEKMTLLNKYNIKFTEPRVVGTARIIFFSGPNNEEFEFVVKV